MILRQEKPQCYHSMVSLNNRLDEIQTAVLNLKFKYLAKCIEQKREKEKLYNKLFENNFSNKIITLYEAPYYTYHIYYQYIVRAQNKDGLRKFLTEYGIGTVVYYLFLLHLQKRLEKLDHRECDCPDMEKFRKEAADFLISSELNNNEKKALADDIERFYERWCKFNKLIAKLKDKIFIFVYYKKSIVLFSCPLIFCRILLHSILLRIKIINYNFKFPGTGNLLCTVKFRQLN